MRWLFETKQEAEQRRQRQRDKVEAKRLRKTLEKEGAYYADKFPYWLAQMGIDHRLAVRLQPSLAEEIILGRTGRNMVPILEVRLERSAIYLRVDTQGLPYLAKLKNLYDPDVLETLSDQAGRQVLYRSVPGNGTWYIVVRDGAINAIPKIFPFVQASKMVPDSAPPLTFIVGEKENRKVVDADLARLPHYLIAGATFTGKSVHLNSIICQFLERNTPDELQFMMIDLKGGSELGLYENIPHLRWPIITKPEDVVDALAQYRALVIERVEKYARRGGIKNIEGWNYQNPMEKDPYLLLIFDEVGEVLAHTNRNMAKEAEGLLESIMAIARAGGGHVILSTQRPAGDVIKPWITSNASTRICFAVATQPSSILVVGKGSAAGLEPQGRAMFLNGPQLVELQAPLIEDHEIKRIVAQAVAGKTGEPPAEIRQWGLDDILEEAVDNLGGSLAEKPLYAALRGKIARDKIRALVSSLNGNPIIVHGKTYKIVEKRRGITRTRLLEEVQRALPELPMQSPRLSRDLFPRGRGSDGSDAGSW